MTNCIRVEPMDATLGAAVRGIDLREPLGDEAFGALHDAWLEHAVLVFPEQFLDDESHQAFSRRFGRLERVITRREGSTVVISNLSNVREDGSLIEPDGRRALFLKGNSYWHTDSSFKRVPAKASILSARQVPTEGGETEFADMRAAWDRLEPEMQSRLEGTVALHSYRYSQGKVGGLDLLGEDDLDNLPPVEHPVVRTHPETGRKNLYIGRHASHILGEDVAESRELLETLCDEACRPPRTFSHRWKAGDLVMWDNRCVLHRGRPYPPDQPRQMRRTTVAGDQADNEWAV
ncbi:MAG: TauD/TfdA family dioxygenase [Immundisolibacterales bacterium]|nr:TauD/TfdA family dioxygenase [Immundisolibacterales bacterium]